MSADASRLAETLRRHLKGDVRFDSGSRALYATDASNYRQVPIGVVIPRDVADVVTTVDICRGAQVPILVRGGGTSLAGQCCNVAVVVDMSKYVNRVIEIDPVARLARVEPGVILDEVRTAAQRFGLTFGPDPATHNRCTIGGMIGNNSCGVHSVMSDLYGPGPRTAENVERLDILLYDGSRLQAGPSTPGDLSSGVSGGSRAAEIGQRLQALIVEQAARIRREFPDIPRRVSGYNLPALLTERGSNVGQALVGSEGTCAFVLEATLRLIPAQPARSLLVVGYPDIYTAADDVPQLLSYRPVGLEGMDEELVRAARAIGIHPNPFAILPDGCGWLLAEFGGDSADEAQARAEAAMQDLRGRPSARTMKVCTDAESASIWRIRESALAVAARVGEEHPLWEGWEDSAVPPERLGEYLRALRKLLQVYRYQGTLYGHFGQGCVHLRINFDLESAPGIRKFRQFVTEAADLVTSLGGSISGEHGDGQARGELLRRMFSAEMLDVFRAFKRIWDPAGLMNPGKLIDARPLDADLRLGADYRPPSLPTHFQFPHDRRQFSTTTLRCVGVGACRQLEHGTMCPSFMVTREEAHSTRGRARLLFEMLEGDPLTGVWREEHVKDALDLCLACKGCKKDCPASVDMATYKAEFLSHYYERRLRPRHAFAFGRIDRWARLGSLTPGPVNFIGRAPGLRAAAKWIAGMAPERAIPSFAAETFRQWFSRRPPPDRAGSPTVILWPDTFTNHFCPDIGKAAVRVLEAAGHTVRLPPPGLCCGRPLYDYGFLEIARRQLRDIMNRLRDDIEAGTPIVGLEPSCVAVFRDELGNLFPDDPLAKRLATQTLLVSEFLSNEPRDWTWPALQRRAIVHVHCHHKAVLDAGSDLRVLRQLGVDARMLDSGCCGMAGSFGFEAGHYDISVRIGERVLLPEVRQADPETLIVADGFSCREQILQTTGRRAWHPIEVVAMAMKRD